MNWKRVSMSGEQKSAFVMLLLLWLSFLVSPAYSAYGTLDRVVISAPSSCQVNQEVPVEATIYTERSGWGTCTVRDVQAVLILPDTVYSTSGDNELFIGSIRDGASSVASWVVVFEKNGTYELQVRVSGYDSDNNPCTIARSTTILVGESASSYLPFDIPILILVSVIIILMAVLVVALIIRRYKHAPRNE